MILIGQLMSCSIQDISCPILLINYFISIFFYFHFYMNILLLVMQKMLTINMLFIVSTFSYFTILRL
jgi:hypothetical protein